MNFRLIAATAATLIITLPGTAMAASCFDMWYARNAIYDANGYCFKSGLALKYFDNGDCWTTKPKFSKKEWAVIVAIKNEEEARGCKVN